jgi:Cytochrome c
MRPLRKSLAALLLLGCAAPVLADRAVIPEVIPNAEQMTPEQREAYRARQLVGNAERGAKLHQGCFGCHGLERYTAPVTHASATFFDSMLRASGLSDLPPTPPKRFKGRITSMDDLRQAVISRNDYLNPKLSAQEVEDVVAWLNATYYKFPNK